VKVADCGNIWHILRQLGGELLTLDRYFPSPLLPSDQAYPEGYDEEGNTEKHHIVKPPRREIRDEVVDNAGEQQAGPNGSRISHKGKDPYEDHKAEEPKEKQEQVRNQEVSRGNQIGDSPYCPPIDGFLLLETYLYDLPYRDPLIQISP